jgi:hypothetical protein
MFAVTMRVFLSKSAVIIDDIPLARRMNTAAVRALAGTPISEREIPMHPEGVRRVHINPTGIVWYVDYPEDRVSHICFAVSPADTPAEPPTAFKGSIWLNGLELTADTSEAAFLRHGGIEVQGHTHSWAYRTPNHYVSFRFESRRNRIGKRAGTYRLAFVEIDFPKDSEQTASPNGGPSGRVCNSGVTGGPPSVS